jgi:hypothetical protein
MSGLGAAIVLRRRLPSRLRCAGLNMDESMSLHASHLASAPNGQLGWGSGGCAAAGPGRWLRKSTPCIPTTKSGHTVISADEVASKRLPPSTSVYTIVSTLSATPIVEKTSCNVRPTWPLPCRLPPDGMRLWTGRRQWTPSCGQAHRT